MKNSKKGVSLITLIITIVVTIILAGAIMKTVANTDTRRRANEAKFKQNMSNYQDELNNYFAKQFLNDPLYKPESLNLSGTNVKTAILSMSDEDTTIFSVVNGKLTVNSDADRNYKTWATQVGVNVAKEITVVESNHGYSNDMNYVKLGTWNYNEASSVNITIEYATEGTKYDWVSITEGTDYVSGGSYNAKRNYLSTSGKIISATGTSSSVKFGGSAKRTKTFNNVNMKSGSVILKSDYSVNDWGTKVTITPNY